MIKSELLHTIKNAIKIEINAQNLYTSLYKKAKTKNGKVLFETLTVEEQKHEVLLKSFMMDGDFDSAKAKSMVYDFKFDVSNKILDPSYDSIEIRSGMILAIKEERKWSNFYFNELNKCSRNIEDMPLRSLYETLAKEELKHERMLIDEYKKMFGMWEEDIKDDNE